jgi:NADPH:quinone reductase-like Zn-dependent oxidoreductase
MKEIRIREHGGYEVLRVSEVPEPEPGPGQVRVAVRYVGVNHLDAWVRAGLPGHRIPLPLVPGADVVGVVDAVGSGVEVTEGTRVALHPGIGCGRCQRCLEGQHDLCERRYRIRGETMDGGCREKVVVEERELLPLLDQTPLASAAAMPLSLLTAWHMLVNRARIRPGQTLLIQAIGSGVGVMAVQLARLMGCTVLGTASTESKREEAVRLGAIDVFAYSQVREKVREHTRHGVDVVVDHVGSATWDESLRALRRGGTLVTCGATSGHKVDLDLRVLFFKQFSLVGSTMGSMGEMATAWEHFLQGRVTPVISATLPMSEIAEAHKMLEGRDVFGKIVLRQDLGPWG